jgi:hypothetical protein
MVELAASGTIRKFTVTPTKKAEAVQLSRSVRGRTGCLVFKVGTYAVEKVPRNEPQEKRGAQFRTVLVVYKITSEPMLRDIQAAGNVKREGERKALVLIQYDPPRKNWNIVTFDAADLNEDFKTNNVANFLEKQE